MPRTISCFTNCYGNGDSHTSYESNTDADTYSYANCDGAPYSHAQAKSDTKGTANAASASVRRGIWHGRPTITESDEQVERVVLNTLTKIAALPLDMPLCLRRLFCHRSEPDWHFRGSRSTVAMRRL